MKPNLLMWLLNWFPFVTVFSSCAVWFLKIELSLRIILCFFILYLLPPILCRILLIIKRPSGIVNLKSADGLIWFATFQLQVIYARLPFIEELLRFVPGLYSLWLNLWGAKVSLWTYWAPGTMIADRWLMHVEEGVVVGARCHIGGHILSHQESEGSKLTLGTVKFHKNSIIGAKAVVGPGCEVEANETLPATYPLPPFCRWAGGKRHKPGNQHVS